MSGNYYAIEGSDLSMKGDFIQDLLQGKAAEGMEGLSGKRGVLHSNITLEQFMEEELRHDRFDLSEQPFRSIRTYSSGEQKKALLDYLVSKSPGFILLDNPFDCLDKQSVDHLRRKLTELASSIPIVQIFKRKADLLPFITRVVRIRDNKIDRIFSLDEYNRRHLHPEKAALESGIPPPAHVFEDIPEKLIEMRKVSVRYGENRILDRINWIIRRGEFWQLSGPNGSGKTTLLTMLYGDNPKAFGQEIYLFGRKKGSGESVWDIKKKIGYFTPSLTELFHRGNTADQMIVSGLNDSIGLYRRATGRQDGLADDWLRVLGLTAMKNISFQKLTQVQQRMILIARAMIKHPPLLILDEPSTGIDDASASRLTALINRIAAESHTAIIYVSHRKEAGLKPQFEYHLTPSPEGSAGNPVRVEDPDRVYDR